MSKVIAIWGAPNSGKTTFATKLARSIYDEYQATVIVVYTDNETPTLPIIFPNYKKEDLCSVGVALAKTDIDRYEVVKQMVTVKDKQNFCFLGFTDGENKHTYPTFDATKVRSIVLLEQIQTLDKKRLVNKVGRLGKVVMDQVDRAARRSLYLEHRK